MVINRIRRWWLRLRRPSQFFLEALSGAPEAMANGLRAGQALRQDAMNELHIPLEDAMVIVRTADRTFVFSSVTGDFQVDCEIQEGAERHYLLAPGLRASEREPDRITGRTLKLSGSTPGYIHLPNTPDQKEG